MTFILIQVAIFVVIYLVFSAVRGISRHAAGPDRSVPPVPARRAALLHSAEVDAQAEQREVTDHARWE